MPWVETPLNGGALLPTAIPIDAAGISISIKRMKGVHMLVLDGFIWPPYRCRFSKRTGIGNKFKQDTWNATLHPAYSNAIRWIAR